MNILTAKNRNWYRDLAIFWPFLLFSWIAIVYVPTPEGRIVGLICAGLSVLAMVLAKEKMFLLASALGFCALRCIIVLLLHGWSLRALIGLILFSSACLVCVKLRGHRALSYEIPNDMSFPDLLVGLASLAASLLILFLIQHVAQLAHAAKT